MRCRNYTRTGRMGNFDHWSKLQPAVYQKRLQFSPKRYDTGASHRPTPGQPLFLCTMGKGMERTLLPVGIGLNQRWMHVGEQKQSTFTIRPMLFVRYTVSPKIELRYQGSVSNIMPTLSAISDYSQEIDFIQIQRGNPNLKPQIDFYNALVFNYKFTKQHWLST